MEVQVFQKEQLFRQVYITVDFFNHRNVGFLVAKNASEVIPQRSVLLLSLMEILPAMFGKVRDTLILLHGR